jgi:hypothetical protein
MNSLPVMNDKLPYTLHTHLPEDDQDMWPKRVGVVCNKGKNIVPIFFDEICVYVNNR